MSGSFLNHLICNELPPCNMQFAIDPLPVVIIVMLFWSRCMSICIWLSLWKSEFIMFFFTELIDLICLRRSKQLETYFRMTEMLPCLCISLQFYVLKKLSWEDCSSCLQVIYIPHVFQLMPLPSPELWQPQTKLIGVPSDDLLPGDVLWGVGCGDSLVGDLLPCDLLSGVARGDPLVGDLLPCDLLSGVARGDPLVGDLLPVELLYMHSACWYSAVYIWEIAHHQFCE